MKKLLSKILQNAVFALRTTCLIVFGILAVVAILLLCIVAIIATVAEKFFALIASIVTSLLAKVGNRFLGLTK